MIRCDNSCFNPWPWIKATIITPDQYLGSIIKICQDKRGIQTNLSYSGNRAVVNYELPLNEVVFDFNDRLKSMTSGYASFDYEIIGHREGDLVKMSILVNSEPVDALAMMIHTDFAQSTGREVCEKLKDLIPRHNFMIPIQACIGIIKLCLGIKSFNFSQTSLPVDCAKSVCIIIASASTGSEFTKILIFTKSPSLCPIIS